MRGDYVKTTWVNGVAPGINATRLNNSENKINEIDKSVISKTARFTVGTSTSGWTAGDVDYLCDGINDQIKINAAITALPATGGEIVILDGTYNITAKISVNKANVTLSGNGNATTLKRMYDSTVIEGVITVETGANFCKIKDLNIYGNKAVYTNTNNYGIYLKSSYNAVNGNICNGHNVGIYLKSSPNNTLSDNNCSGNNYAFYAELSNNNTITGNYCSSNTYGIYLISSNSNAVVGNSCNANTNSGIYLGASAHNTISGNICNTNTSRGIVLFGSSINTISGNTCNDNIVYGIDLDTSNNNVITGNASYNNTMGILLTASNRNNITGNGVIRGTGIAGDYTASHYTILINGIVNNYNLISSNMCLGKDVVNGGGTSNTLVNNKFA